MITEIRFSFMGLIVFLLPMIINIIYFAFPAKGNTVCEKECAEEKRPSMARKAFEMVEQISRILLAFFLCCLVKNTGIVQYAEKVSHKQLFLYVALLFLALYYIVWIRYFIGGRDVLLLSKKFCFIPMPLALFPVLYYIFAAVWLQNFPALIIAIIFGIVHNVLSYQKK